MSTATARAVAPDPDAAEVEVTLRLSWREAGDFIRWNARDGHATRVDLLGHVTSPIYHALRKLDVPASPRPLVQASASPPTPGAVETVHGSCPACGSAGTLFLGSGGYVTCSRRECPEPNAAARLLELARDYRALRDALRSLADVAARYFDTGRGDLDGHVAAANDLLERP